MCVYTHTSEYQQTSSFHWLPLGHADCGLVCLCISSDDLHSALPLCLSLQDQHPRAVCNILLTLLHYLQPTSVAAGSGKTFMMTAHTPATLQC